MTEAFEAMRAAMVASQLRTVGVENPAVLQAMGAIARESFVPVESRPVAYADTAVPVAPGRMMNAPMATARLLNAARIEAGERVLIIGIASGYGLAVASAITPHAVGVECDAALAAEAKEHVPGATVVVGPLQDGAADHAPFDVIVIDGAVEQVPAVLIAQLAPAGRLAGAITDGTVTRLALGRRAGTGFAMIPFADATAVPLPGFARVEEFVF